MSKTLRVIGSVCAIIALGLFIGCSDDNSAPVKPDTPTSMAGSIGVYADAAGTDRNIVDTGSLVTVYVVHKAENGATASQFAVAAPTGWTVVTEQSQFPVSIGNVTDGISIGYGSCQSDVIHVMTITYQSPGNSAGTTFKVVAHKDDPSGMIQVVDCNQNLLVDGIGEDTPVTQ